MRIIAHPEMPKGSEKGIIKGMYPLKTVGKSKIEVQLLGSGTILREVEKAADMLEQDWGCDVTCLERNKL